MVSVCVCVRVCADTYDCLCCDDPQRDVHSIPDVGHDRLACIVIACRLQCYSNNLDS